MTEEFIKGLSTEQLLQHVIVLINDHIALDKSPGNKEAVDQSRMHLMMITKEIEARNAQTV